MTSPALAAAEAAANSQNTRGNRPCSLENNDSRRSGAAIGSVVAASSPSATGLPMLRQMRASMSIANAPGMIKIAIAGQIVPAAAATAATSSGPATAPI